MMNAFLTLILMLPVMLPFAPSEFIHAVHDSHILRYGEAQHYGESNNHELTQHEHEDVLALCGKHGDTNNNFATDIASYYTDYLHADLKGTDSYRLDLQVSIDENSDYEVNANIALQDRYELATIQTRAPPNTARNVYHQNDSTLYLTTLRLRI